MVKDPLTKWDGPFPYDALASVGITPNSTMKEVMDASFELMAQGLMTPEVRAGWDKLRLKGNRLLVDFFLYQFDPQEKLNAAMERLNEPLTELTEVQQQEVEARFIAFEDKPALPDTEFIQFDT